jgi:hypothetical protein
MNEVYEYRRAPSKGAIWLAIIGVLLLMAAVIINGADHLTWLVWVCGTVTLAWMLLPKPVSGIRVDENYLVLSAWRNPKQIPLDNVAYLRATEVSDETEIAIVFKDGTQEGIFAGDLPDIDTLISVMAERGIPVRDVY